MLPPIRLALAAILTITGCMAAPGPSPSPADGAVEVRDGRDGVSIVLRLDARRLEAGSPLRAQVTVTNVLPGVVWWRGGGCELLGELKIEGPPLPAAKMTGADVASLIKFSALGGGPTQEPFVPRDLPEGMPFGCRADLRLNQLDTGASVQTEAVWRGKTSDGLPAPAGTYRVSASFPFLARLFSGQFERDPIQDVRPITVGTTIEVHGEPFRGMSAAEAIDAALADHRVAVWTNTLSRERLGGASIHYTGNAWRLEIEVMDQSRTSEDVGAVIHVDPTTGRVTIERLQPIK